MIRRDKVFELKIEEDDDVSGIDSISLVDEPAIDVMWVAFNKEKMEVGVPHYTADGILYEGPTHKDASGRLMTGAEHTEDSEYLYHEDELPVKEEMESVSDYPESVRNNAKRGIELNEKNNNKCATQVGKVRAQQLADGEPISLETVKRMYSYLSRASEYYDESDTTACGTISYLLWGGKSALSWAESKMNDFGYDVGTITGYVDPDIKKKRKKIIEKAVAKPTLFSDDSNKKAQYFAADSEKQMVLGPAMIPNQKIFRKDQDGSPYYVFFSPGNYKNDCI
jgi:hypothetical protein